MSNEFIGLKPNRIDPPDRLAIAKAPAGLRLTLTTDEAVSGFFDPDDGPAIALEILKASGWGDKNVARTLANLVDSMEDAKAIKATEKSEVILNRADWEDLMARLEAIYKRWAQP